MHSEAGSSETPVILGVMSDLFFSIRIMDAAKQMGMRALFMKDEALILEKIKARPRLVIFDLNCTTADVSAILRAMRDDPATKSIPTLGFVSHVQTEVRQRALADGCGVVVARSVFAQSLTELLRGQITQADEAGGGGTGIN